MINYLLHFITNLALNEDNIYMVIYEDSHDENKDKVLNIFDHHTKQKPIINSNNKKDLQPKECTYNTYIIKESKNSFHKKIVAFLFGIIIGFIFMKIFSIFK
ncbi:hypothetical protein A0H76_1723 [Hepatospora eriocheir]|uniref:Uncharacterized protein n=1 Tax=Hepatospora eriocheir TaxID=1081669 RepID=A0A1X0QGY0_9MICR|nr:hypothetical protein A0H76_1723 [Hepatospora eriocheir]